MKQIINMLFVGVFGLTLAGCGGSDSARIAELEAQIEELKSNKDTNGSTSATSVDDSYSSTTSSYRSSYRSLRDEEEDAKKRGVGTYEFTDEVGHTWVIVLKSDETATCSLKDGSNLCYASWDPTNFLDYAPGLEFNDESPVVWFPSGQEKLYLPHIVDGYLYDTGSDAQAKNPRKRLKIKKVK